MLGVAAGMTHRYGPRRAAPATSAPPLPAGLRAGPGAGGRPGFPRGLPAASPGRRGARSTDPQRSRGGVAACGPAEETPAVHSRVSAVARALTPPRCPQSSLRQISICLANHLSSSSRDQQVADVLVSGPLLGLEDLEGWLSP